MLEAAVEIGEFVEALDLERFSQDRRKDLEVITALQVLGKAATV